MVTGSAAVEWYTGILQNLRKESFVKTLRVKAAPLTACFSNKLSFNQGELSD
jgi:hypothetical protein